MAPLTPTHPEPKPNHLTEKPHINSRERMHSGGGKITTHTKSFHPPKAAICHPKRQEEQKLDSHQQVERQRPHTLSSGIGQLDEYSHEISELEPKMSSCLPCPRGGKAHVALHSKLPPNKCPTKCLTKCIPDNCTFHWYALFSPPQLMHVVLSRNIPGFWS